MAAHVVPGDAPRGQAAVGHRGRPVRGRDRRPRPPRRAGGGPGATGLRAFLALWRGIVIDTDFRAGCPVLAVSIEEPPPGEIPPALAAAAAVFDDWEKLLANSLREHGAAPGRAEQLATLIVAAVEGTVAMCRAKRSVQPPGHTAEQLQALIAAAVEG